MAHAVAEFFLATVLPGQVVFIDRGTTVVQMARHLPESLRATVVTHSPSVAIELAGHAGLTTADLEEAHIKRALMAALAQTVVRASTEKIGTASACVLIPPRPGVTLLEAPSAPARALAASRKAVAGIVQADPAA